MNKIPFPFMILAMTIIFLGCPKSSDSPVVEDTGKGPAPAPAPAVTEKPAPAPIADTPTAQRFDGEWKGTSGEDSPLHFKIKANEVKSLQASYSANVNNCSSNGSYGIKAPAPIQDQAFTATGSSPSGKVSFTLTGNLNSPNNASGTVEWKGTSAICGDIDLKYSWKAEKIPAGND